MLFSQTRCKRLAKLDGGISVAVLTAFSGVRFAPDSIHRYGESRVGLRGDRTQGHRARGKPFYDFLRRLHFIKWHRCALVKAELEQSPEGHVTA